MKKHIALAALLAGAGLLATPAVAQQSNLANPRGAVTNFDPANIGPVLTELGVVWQVRNAEGRTFIAAAIGNGQFYFNIIPSACVGPNNTGCVGANIIAYFDGVTTNHQTIEAFNQAYAFTTAGALQGSAVYLSRYEIADFGIPRGNVESSLGSFVGIAQRFLNELASSSQTVSQEGYADDMSSNYLNRVSAEGIGVPAASTGAVAEWHQIALDEFPAVLKDIAASDAPKNMLGKAAPSPAKVKN
ncbi:MAG: hypothetical protein R3C58_00545 [Parvularculaceae bacterium]